MPMIKTMSEFREALRPLLLRPQIKGGLTDDEIKALEFGICSLALDYADGFYRDVAGLVNRKG